MMTSGNSKAEIVKTYYQNLLHAGTELAKKELLKTLLVRLFDKDTQAAEIINKISLGSEHTVFNIPLPHRTKTGSADSQYDQVIIEFEKDLRKTGEHAKDQLAEYLAGNWNSGMDYHFTLIATDCLQWVVYAPEYESIMGKPRITLDDLHLREIDNFTLTGKNADDFFYFLDRYLFRSMKIKPTLANIQHDFGDTSATFLTCIRKMSEHFEKVRDIGEVKVSFDEWQTFLSIAYGSFKGSKDVFLVHTYLSIFSKILAYAVLSHDDFIDDREMQGIIRGDIFAKYNLDNFIEHNFYHWVAADENLRALKPVFRTLAQRLSQYDFSQVDEDILKGIYQELIDLETRHSLGEYYTPDWLCEKITEHCEFKRSSMILDPACGSGSFLRAAIARLKTLFPNVTADVLLDQVVGIDIHPLSVQIAKTTVLLAMGRSILKAPKPVQLRIYLANSLFAPEGAVDLFEDNCRMIIDREALHISSKVFGDAQLFDLGIKLCDDLAEGSSGKTPETLETLTKTLRRHYTAGPLLPETIDDFYKIYLRLKQVKEEGRDSIWKFILQNSYKPFFLKKRFDFVIGNPPWLTMADIENADYQNRLKNLASKYFLIPNKVANFPHLEIAAIFLAHAANFFLKPTGTTAFVLPRAFMTADHHDNTRSGRAGGFILKEIWDLDEISTLFRVPSCVFFTQAVVNKPERKPPASGLPGLKLSGRLKYHNITLKEVHGDLAVEPATYFYSKLKDRSAFTTAKLKNTQRVNAYNAYFKQGATIVPRNCYFIQITQEFDGDIRNRYLTVETSKESRAEAKPPWKEIHLSGKIHSSFLFYTALAKNIVPFGLINPPKVLLPVKLGDDKRIVLQDWKGIKDNGFLETAQWFKQVEDLWNTYKTENNKNITSIDYLNWQNKLTDQNLNKPYLVLYTASAKDANAVVIKRKDRDLDFIADHKAYVFFTSNLQEAHYLTAYLNSATPNEMIKEFQSRGLFGPRDVHKKILEVPFPKFDPANKKHLELAALGQACAEQVQTHIRRNVNFNDYNVGRVRVEIKKTFTAEFQKIDKLVDSLIRGK